MIAFDHVGITQGSFALHDVSFTIPAGGYAVLMGRTGSGKTTLLEAVAGLRPLTAGRILLDSRDVTRVPPAGRGVGYVPQESVLFRTMTVYENLAFSLELRKVPADRIRQRVTDLAGWLGLTPLLERRAVGLSGGEAQRVALGRALAFEPRVLLLDEPLSAVDETTRGQLVELLQGLRKRADVTILHVTHSRSEAEQLGDMILRIEDGRVAN